MSSVLRLSLSAFRISAAFTLVAGCASDNLYEGPWEWSCRFDLHCAGYGKSTPAGGVLLVQLRSPTTRDLCVPDEAQLHELDAKPRQGVVPLSPVVGAAHGPDLFAFAVPAATPAGGFELLLSGYGPFSSNPVFGVVEVTEDLVGEAPSDVTTPVELRLGKDAAHLEFGNVELGCENERVGHWSIRARGIGLEFWTRSYGSPLETEAPLPEDFRRRDLGDEACFDLQLFDPYGAPSGDPWTECVPVVDERGCGGDGGAAAILPLLLVGRRRGRRGAVRGVGDPATPAMRETQR